ncbi:MAG: CPBP family intramembrane metalloprotease [Lachnospiraceae bacterium]|nr:CPBP family intramembrane metalloprotease [Lachnospiraceae bacterium]
MRQAMRRRGSVWRVIVPLLIYSIGSYAASVVVVFYYTLKNGYLEKAAEQVNIEEYARQVVIQMMGDQAQLSFAILTVTQLILIPIFFRMMKKDFTANTDSNKIGVAAASAITADSLSHKEGWTGEQDYGQYTDDWNRRQDDSGQYTDDWNRGRDDSGQYTDGRTGELTAFEKAGRLFGESSAIGQALCRIKVPARWFGLLLLAAIGLDYGGSYMILMSGLMDKSAAYQTVEEAIYSAGFLPEILVLGILSPIMEELLFRGLIYRRFKEMMPLIASLVWSSILFALFHGNLAQGIYGFVSGLFLCYVYERYGTFLAPLLTHMFCNIAAVIGSETTFLDFTLESKGIMIFSTMIFCIFILAAIVGIEMYVRPYTETTGDAVKA